MKQEWWSTISSEIQKDFDENDLKLFYSDMHELFNPLTSSMVPLPPRDKTMVIKGPEKILLWWQRYFVISFDIQLMIIADVLENK